MTTFILKGSVEKNIPTDITTNSAVPMSLTEMSSHQQWQAADS